MVKWMNKLWNASCGEHSQFSAGYEIDHTVHSFFWMSRPSHPVCKAPCAVHYSSSMSCSKTHRLLLSVGRWRHPPLVIKNTLLSPFNLELLQLGHISPLQPPWLLISIKMSVAVLGWISSFGGLIEFYLDFIKHLDKPIKEVADCSHQHLIHHAVRGIKSDWH